MPTPDDEPFEKYLKQFRPLPGEPLKIEEPGRSTRRSLAFAAWAGIAAVLLVLTVLALRISPKRSAAGIGQGSSAEQFMTAQPLTLGRANALLTGATSFKAALDNMAFHAQTSPLSKDERSAVAILSKEKIKL